MDLPHTRVSRTLDKLIERIGEMTAWLWPILLFVIVLNVTMRYAFDQGRIEFEEIQWHLYSIGFLVALSHGLQADAHIRVDVVRGRLSPRMQAWIELYGLLLLVVPFVSLIIIYAAPFVLNSFIAGEVSSSPGGLPHRWLIKSILLIGFALLLLAALSRLTRIWVFLFPK